jgi:tRNA wybutosine-synthesizing protein 2
LNRTIPQKEDREIGNFAAIVNKEKANAAIEEILGLGLLDLNRKVLAKQRFVEIPVKKPLTTYQTVFQENPEFYKRTPKLSDLLKNQIDKDLLSILPHGWFILGEIIIVKIPYQLDQFKHQIGIALLSIYPRCKSVMRDFGIEGQFREPVREIIAGKSIETIHKENGILFKLDAKRIMFSQGNLRERIRMSHFGHNETIVDMFAGIGYFSLPMAVYAKPKRILAIELNPVAYKYLCENVRINHVESIIKPVLGDCGEQTPPKSADRVVMGYVGTTNRYLKTAISALRDGGTLHYHQTISSKNYPDEAINDIIKVADRMDRKVEVLKCIRVKKYSPGVVHTVVDARIAEEL